MLMAGKTLDGRSWIRCEKCGYVVYGRNTDEAYELYEEHVKKCRIDRRKLELAIEALLKIFEETKGRDERGR